MTQADIKKNMTTLRATPLSLPSLRLEGGLFLPDILEKAALGKSLLQCIDCDL